jgi:acylphosphatase
VVTAPANERVLVRVSGVVQGVGFRWWTRSRALELGLVGWAMNRDDGRVEVVAEGPREALEVLVARLAVDAAPSVPPRPGRVDQAVVTWRQATGVPAGFVER